MKIVIGASSLKTALERIDEGADELFCGYISSEWYERYGYMISPNRRWGKSANFMSLTELRRTVGIAHAHNVKISMTVNAHNYSPGQWDLLKKMLDELASIGIDAFIVADIGILLYLRENYPDIPVHISTGGTVFNRDAVEFYRQFGVTRIIFPRSVNMQEAEIISDQYLDMEFEVFISNARCVNIDGYCYFEHAIFYLANEVNGLINFPMCGVDYTVENCHKENLSREGNEQICQNLIRKRNFNAHPKACAACYLFTLNQHNIKFVKIPARASFDRKNRGKIISELKFIKDMITVLPKFQSGGDYEEFAREKFAESFGVVCQKNGENCYF